MARDIVVMKAPDGVVLNVDSSCVPIFKKAGYTIVESEAEEKQAEKKKQKASK